MEYIVHTTWRDNSGEVDRVFSKSAANEIAKRNKSRGAKKADVTLVKSKTASNALAVVINKAATGDLTAQEELRKIISSKDMQSATERYLRK